ncbi:MAG: bifunctional DNA-formamidopyrimidine glycosylase/DNA-(apurinic or apyrimidinic site) lyase [Nitrospirae bacterium]|nr:bifunctional DNA-formamidopyrimidine glycosylase/DNA-(apurinic or apyrimidinic site) lyase [Nitrospirota bacterium]
MPELPEVEVIKDGLRRKLRNRTIKGVDILFKGSIKNLSPPVFGKRMLGRKFEDVSRRGKFLIFSLDNGSFLIIHLRMTGQLTYCPSNEEADKYLCLKFILDNGYQLRFMDMRRFGVVYLVKKLEEITTLANLGPEPLESNFTALSLEEILKGQKKKVKIVLMDQNLIAGIGNIYATEALYQAKINPERKANQLTEAEVKELHRAIRDILQRSISARGTSTDNYRDAEGKKGNFQYQLQVYQRGGEPCSRCGAKISQIKISGRSTYFCPSCQK